MTDGIGKPPLAEIHCATTRMKGPSIEVADDLERKLVAAVKRRGGRKSDVLREAPEQCLVRLCALYDGAAVTTGDRDFVVDRKRGRPSNQPIAPLLRCAH